MKILKSSVLVAFCIVISRISGLIRDLFIASLFGVSARSDSLQIALRLPTSALCATITKSIPSVFVPTFASKMIESKESAGHFANNVFSMTIVLSTVLVIIAQLFMPHIVFVLAPGFYDSDEFTTTISLCRITACYIVFGFLSTLFGEILNALSKFTANALSPFFLNLSMIICTYFLSNIMHLEYAICCAFTCGGVIQLLFIYLNLLSKNVRLSLSFSWKSNSLKHFYKKFWNAMLNFSIFQVNVMVYYAIASFIPGSITTLLLADRLCFLPLSVISLGFNTTLLTELSKLYKNNLIDDANILLTQSIKWCCFLILPSATGMAVLSYQIIELIYQHGAFTPEDSSAVSLVVKIYTIGLPAFILYKVLSVVFYAQHNINALMRVTILNVALNITLNLLLSIKLSYLGLVISPIISTWIAVILLFIYNNKCNYYTPTWSIFTFVCRILIACLVMAIAVTMVVNEDLYSNALVLEKSTLLSFYIITGIIVYFAMCYILQIFNLRMIKNSILIKK